MGFAKKYGLYTFVIHIFGAIMASLGGYEGYPNEGKCQGPNYQISGNQNRYHSYIRSLLCLLFAVGIRAKAGNKHSAIHVNIIPAIMKNLHNNTERVPTI
jgi:hypothetical protein